MHVTMHGLPPPPVPTAIGRLCEKCDGKCPICDSYVRPATLVRVCDECNYGSYEGRCVICGGMGVSDAYYCKECTLQEKDVSRGLAQGPGALVQCQRCRSNERSDNVLHPCFTHSEMAAPRLSTLGQQRRTCSMSGKRCALGQTLVETWRSELGAESKHTRSAASATCRAVLMLLMLLATCPTAQYGYRKR